MQALTFEQRVQAHLGPWANEDGGQPNKVLLARMIGEQPARMKAASLRAAAWLLFSCIGFSGSTQLYDMRWIGGYQAPEGGIEFGGNKTVFAPPAATPSVLQPHQMMISAGMAVITDGNDSIIAYTNGWHLADASHQPMLHGGGLNPSTIVDTTYGLHSANSQLFIPRPDDPTTLVLVHLAPDAVNAGGNIHSARIYHTLIDTELNAGLAGVVSKNNVILEAPLLAGGLSAVRHANGRDWWILTHGIDSDAFISFILTPYGFEGPFYQPIGTWQTGSVPCASFSPNGDRLAYTGYQTGLDVYDFDRCTGILSNWQHAAIDDSAFTRSVQFSPDGSKIYVSSVTRVYQYDLAAGVLSVPETVATYDGFYDEFPILQTFFANMCLAPDGRIYVSTGNGTRYMHVVHNPDGAGPACNLVQHEHNRQTWTANSIPYRPNYVLGPVDGSVCDSLGITVGASDAQQQASVQVLPNPSNGRFTIGYPAQLQAGALEVMDAAGRVVYRHRLSAWSTLHQVQLPNAVPGLYHCRLSWASTVLAARVLITREP